MKQYDPIKPAHGATRKIREFNNEVVIIAQTAFTLPKDQKKALESGCNDYITKSLSKGLLLKIVDNHLKGKF